MFEKRERYSAKTELHAYTANAQLCQQMPKHYCTEYAHTTFHSAWAGSNLTTRSNHARQKGFQASSKIDVDCRE